MLSSGALASTVEEDFTGTVSGIDYSGLFGAPGSNLNGLHFSAAYLFDTSLGTATADHTEVSGGTIYGIGSPLISASITINGHTIFDDGLWDAFLIAKLGTTGALAYSAGGIGMENLVVGVAGISSTIDGSFSLDAAQLLGARENNGFLMVNPTH